MMEGDLTMGVMGGPRLWRTARTKVWGEMLGSNTTAGKLWSHQLSHQPQTPKQAHAHPAGRPEVP